MKKLIFLAFVLVALLSINVIPAYASSEFENNEETIQTYASPKCDQVYLGGYPLGLTIDGRGVTVVALREFIGDDGKLTCPAMLCGIAVGDTVIEIDGVSINNSTKLAEITAKSQGRKLNVVIMRGSVSISTNVTPIMDLQNRQYRIGLWTKDSNSGIGTLTYYKPNLQFGCLGHPICDSSGKIIETTNGGVYYGNITDVKKGQKGSAGELKGNFDVNKRMGEIYCNNKFGVFGTLSSMPQYDSKLIDVAAISEARVGKAEIYSTVSTGERKCYQIEIIKVVNQHTADDKGMVIRVVDDELLATTGGIVQGMSGSPIVQNGKLIGAVTHVFINDPTRGYGVFAQWMLDN